MKSSKLTLIIALSFFVNSLVYSQSSITVTGGLAIGNDGNIAYSAGFLKSISASGTDGEIIQGVHNNFNLPVISAANKQSTDLSIHTFPNPVKDILILNTDASKLKYRLLTPEGKILMENDIIDNLTQIKMLGFAPALYILQVSSNREIVKSFKILKN